MRRSIELQQKNRAVANVPTITEEDNTWESKAWMESHSIEKREMLNNHNVRVEGDGHVSHPSRVNKGNRTSF